MINDWIFGQPTVILISGKAGAGKSTAADFFMTKLAEIKGITTIKTSFAKNVKEVAVSAFGWNGIKDLKGRQLLQNIGNTGRAYDKDFWVKETLSYVNSTFGSIPPNVIVIDDWRFPNEVEFLQKEGFKVWKIKIISDRLEENINKNDISETSLNNYDGFDIEIINNKSMREFEILLDLSFQLILKEAM